MPNFDGPRPLRREDLPGSYRLLKASFGDFSEAEPVDPESAQMPTEGETYLIADGSVPVCQISIFYTDLKVYGSALRVGSIGGVCTLPEYRGHGLASQLLDFCTRKLVEGGASLMLISGWRGLYRRSGCVPAGRYAGLEVPAAPATPSVTLRPIRPEDAPLCRELYLSEPVHFNRRLSAFTEQFQPHPIGFRAEEWMVEMEGRPCAYLILSTPWEVQTKPESGVRHIFEYAGSRAALAGALTAARGQLSLKQLLALVPWQDADLIHLLEAAGALRTWMVLPDHTFRIINFPALASGLRPYIAARLSPALRRGLAFQQTGPLLGADGIDCLTIARGADRLALNGEVMTKLVMGSDADLGLSLPGALKEIIPALFPLPSFLPGMDYH